MNQQVKIEYLKSSDIPELVEVIETHQGNKDIGKQLMKLATDVPGTKIGKVYIYQMVILF